jgi:hypothetical protein
MNKFLTATTAAASFLLAAPALATPPVAPPGFHVVVGHASGGSYYPPAPSIVHCGAFWGEFDSNCTAVSLVRSNGGGARAGHVTYSIVADAPAP